MKGRTRKEFLTTTMLVVLVHPVALTLLLRSEMSIGYRGMWYLKKSLILLASWV